MISTDPPSLGVPPGKKKKLSRFDEKDCKHAAPVLVKEERCSWPLDHDIECLDFQPSGTKLIGFVNFDYKPVKVLTFTRPLRKLLGLGKVLVAHVKLALRACAT